MSAGGLLNGVRVLDFGQYFAGPFGARLLADLGADVIKVENLTGDSLRPLDRVFSAAQRGKRAIAVDLKSRPGKDIAHRLCRTADVVIHNLRPGVAERLGLGYDDVASVKNDIVYVYCPGWGASGPDAMRQGFAFMFLGLVGLQYEVAGEGNPPTLPVGNEDTTNGLLAAAATVMALFRRARTGEGQYIESPQLNSAMFMAMHLFREHSSKRVHGSTKVDAEQLGSSARNRLYRTADGWICVVAATDAELDKLAAALDVSPQRLRSLDDTDLWNELEKLIAPQTTEALAKAFSSHGVPHAIPRTDGGLSVLRDQEAIGHGRIAEYTHPTFGVVREPGCMVRSHSTQSATGPAPLLGQHTEQVLRELGFDAATIGTLREQGIVS